MTAGGERQEWLRKKPNYRLSGKLKIGAWIVTALVFVLVGLMRRPDLKIPLPEGVDLGFLPPIHALLNSAVAVCLIVALSAIRGGNVRRHRAFMLSAIALSVVFLLGYVAYHFTTVETLFGDADGNGNLEIGELQSVGLSRPIYMLLLVTHILAAAVSLPLILLTFISALTNRFRDHRSMAHWVFPIWLYVAITGPICYFMLRPYY
ncbi:DUF420 domain-containing protein [Luteolibacter algae]|uniref:DUF420 domain-containing protein n=1 Tax=Luteolibacter algae TaxID=454151 RepID=A0ABW5D8C2_9BACT